MSGKWHTEEDKKLAELFCKGPRKGGISSQDLSTKAIKEINDQFFQRTNFQSFSKLFRNKARQWNINQTLTGQRRSKLFLLLSTCFVTMI